MVIIQNFTIFKGRLNLNKVIYGIECILFIIKFFNIQVVSTVKNKGV